jgi:hypothetical protein
MSKILSYQVSLRSAFHVVMSATISALKRRSVRPDLQMFVGDVCIYVICVCLRRVVSNKYCVEIVADMTTWNAERKDT